MLNPNRKFKEIRPDLVGNKFAAKPPEQQQNQTITVYMTAAEKKKCEEAATRRKSKPGTWARQTLLAQADLVMSEPYDTTAATTNHDE